jgi:hypothetical protein
MINLNEENDKRKAENNYLMLNVFLDSMEDSLDIIFGRSIYITLLMQTTVCVQLSLYFYFLYGIVFIYRLSWQS